MGKSIGIPSKFRKFSFLFSILFLLYAFDTFGPRTDNGPTTVNDFVNFETPHVHPMDITPNQQKLLAVNTADNRLEVYQIQNGNLTHLGSIPVGIDPVTVRARSNSEAWVVNHVSDNVSIIDLNLNVVTRILRTENEPCDVVFAGSPQKAFVSCSEANKINVFNLSNLNASPQAITLIGEEPRAMAVSPDGNTVYTAFFESGNQTTIVPGGKIEGPQAGRAKDAVRHPAGPYGGIDVPPNDGANFNPPINPNLPPPPPVSIIVKKNNQNQWIDDNNGDWSPFISGNLSTESHRQPGWDLPDRDVAVMNANNLSVSYQNKVMNLLMAMEVNPSSGKVAVVGTDATNEIRFEQNLKGKFMRINWAGFNPNGSNTIKDMNTHLNYNSSNIPQSQRNLSISDPRGIAWNSGGTKCYVTGMATDNVIVLDANGNRLSNQPIEVGEGPTGIVVHELSNRAFVMNKFSGDISIINLSSETETGKVDFYDPTPEVIKQGRPHLYNAHENSGLGHISCATCHVDARTDRLAWDLGNPEGEIEFPNPLPPVSPFGGPFNGFHPMKGPLRTSTLQDITRYPSLHWRGDRNDLEDFAEAYETLQGDDAAKPLNEIAEFNAFLSSIHFAPNPNRNLDNSLKNSIGILGPNNSIVGFGNPSAAIGSFQSACVSCHPGHRGRSDILFENFLHVDNHQVPESFRGFYERNGFYSNGGNGNTNGFGKLPDGSEFFNLGQLDLPQQESWDMEALLVSFDGGVPWASEGDHPSLDAHSAVGQQVTARGSLNSTDQSLLNQFKNFANNGTVGLIVKGLYKGEHRGFTYLGNDAYQSDKAKEIVSHSDLLNDATSSSPITFTVVPWNTRMRTGIDRDSDGIYDGDEGTTNAPTPLANSLTVTSDDRYEVYFNGIFIGENDVWQTAEIYNQLAVRPGENVIAIKAEDLGGAAGLIAELKIDGNRSGTNNQWKVTNQNFTGWKEINFNDNGWTNASDFGGFGEGPWQNDVINIAEDTPARWIWTNDNVNQNTLFARFSFSNQATEALELCRGEVLFSETFESNLSAWSSTSNATIQGQEVRLTNNENMQSSTGSSWTDYTISATVKMESGSAGMVFRKLNNSNYYLWEFRNDGRLRARKKQGGNLTTLRDIELGLATNINYELSIVADGNTISTYINQRLVDVLIDNSFTQGRIGLWSCNGCSQVARFDNIQVCGLDEPDTSCSWSTVASENQSFSLSTPTLVRYGTNGLYHYRTLSGNVNCNDATFGDPIGGSSKQCFTCGGSNPQNQTISFSAIADKFTTDDNFNLSAAASSSLPVSFTVLSGPATVVGNTVILDGVEGTVTIRASQAGNASWNAAPNVNRSFTVILPPDPGNCTTPTNVASGKASSQSSIKQGGLPERANDGNTNGNFYSQFSVSLTSWENEAWWEVDLGERFDIEDINIWNRTDCCGEHLSEYYILISDTPFNSQDLNPTINQSGVSNYYQPGEAQLPTSVNIGRTGRYVRVQLDKSAFIGLAEVEVMGCPIGTGPGNNAPTVNFVSPTDQQSFVEGNNISVEANANDSDGNITRVELYYNNQFVRSETSVPYTWNAAGQNDGALQNLTVGTHTLKVIAFDDDNASSEKSIQIVVTEDGGGGPCTIIENIAIGKPSLQSSTRQGGVADRANDGNTSGNFYSEFSVALTGWENQAWWEVDLGEVSDIDQVNIWNRTDCCGEWLREYYVLVSDTPFNSQGLNATLNQAGVSSYFQSGEAQFPSSATINRTGRYVRIQLLNSSFLGLAEVEIIGCEGSNQTNRQAPAYQFAARQGIEARTVEIEWIVDETLNPSLYTLEHAANGDDFAVIQQQIPLGTHDYQAYSNVHAKPVTGANQYRLRIDYPSGAFRYLYSEDIYFERTDRLIAISPNPAVDFVHVDLSALKAHEEEFAIFVYDLRGVEVLAKQVSGRDAGVVRLDVSGLRSGMYEVVVKSPVQRAVVGKLVKAAE